MKLKWVYGVLIIAWASTLFAATPAETVHDNILRAVLSNGLRVTIVRDPLAPVVSTVINYEVGSDEAPAGFPGMAHAQEHMMFRGSPGLTAAQLARLSAAIGGDFDADTQQMATQYFFTTPAEDLDIALHIEALRMRGIDSTEALWGQERGAIEQEVAQDLSNPEYVFYTNLLALVFKGTPYAYDALGSRPSFDKTSGAMLSKFHNTWYVPNNAILVIVGDVQPADALARVKNLFDGIPQGNLPLRPEFNFRPVDPQTIKLDTDQPSGMVVIAFRLPGSDSPDFAATQVMADVLGSQRSRLYSLVPQGLALSASFSYDVLPHGGLGYATCGFPAGADSSALAAQMIKMMLQDANNGISGDLVEASRRREVAALEFQKNSVSGLAMAWSQALAIEGRDSVEDDVNAIRLVRSEDVAQMARQCLDTNHAIITILSPRPSGSPTSSKGFGGKESFATTEAAAVKMPEWAERAIQRLEIPASTLHPIVTVLTNGLTLIIQPESIGDTINIYGRIKNNPDLESPTNKDGVDDALSQLFPYGTQTLDRLAFQKALDDIAADETAGTDFSLGVLAEHFDRGLELLAANELTPALPVEAFSILKPQMAAAVAGELESPGYLQTRALKRALFPPSDPSQRHASPDTIKNLTMDDVIRYYHRAYRPDLTTLVIIGKVDPILARNAVMKYFGGWSAQGPQPPTLLPAVPPNGPLTAVVPDRSRVQDDVTLAEVAGLTLSNPDRYALEMGNHVLGGAFYATRLYHDLREEAGLVYFVDSSLQFGETRSIYKVSYACDPPNVARARAIILGNLKSMQERDVTAEELRQAKALLLREIPLSESSVERIADGWLYRSTHHLPLDEPSIAARHYFELTAPQIRAAFRQWIHPGDLIEVTQGPVPP
jgi:zinc protease